MDYVDKSDVGNKYNNLKRIWDNKEIVIIEGEKTKIGIGNDLLSNAKSIERIICPSKNAFLAYDKILASAIKESYGGLVVGTNSYGKGTVQQTKKLLDGSMIKYTTQKWLTPEGNFINEVGVTPTNEVKLNEEYYSNPSDDNDNQLQEALNLLTK